MPKLKLEIIVLFQNLGEQHRYYMRSPAPPLSGVLLAGLTPDCVDVTLRHEMIRPVDYDTDADCVALSFMDYCAPHAIEVARRFRALGKTVIAGGRYASTFPERLAGRFDSVVVGEAERVWPQVVRDLVAGRLRPRYEAPFAPDLADIPPPRYDLVEPQYAIPLVTEATRGCPFRCTYCQLNIAPKPFRTRPVRDVIRDLTATAGLPYHKRKLAMVYDNNVGGDLKHAKALLREVAKLDLWAVGLQFTMNCLEDEEFVDLMVEARVAMAFLGMESLAEASLAGVNKGHNVVRRYEEQFLRLRERGILIFAGFMVGLPEDTPDYYRTVNGALDRVGPSAILSSIAIPIPGTPLHAQVAAAGRIADDDLSHYEGDHLVFRPETVTPEEVLDAYERIPAAFYAWPAVARRWWRLMRDYWTGSHGRRRLLRSPLLTMILLQLTRFQRFHLDHKVRPVLAGERAKWAVLGRLRADPDGSRHAVRPGDAPARATVPAGDRALPAAAADHR